MGRARRIIQEHESVSNQDNHKTTAGLQLGAWQLIICQGAETGENLSRGEVKQLGHSQVTWIKMIGEHRYGSRTANHDTHINFPIEKCAGVSAIFRKL